MLQGGGFIFKGVFFTLPIIGGIIGWLTNYIAVKMIFHPREPVNILGIRVQGLLPKRRRELAVQISETVEKELISASELGAAISDESTKIFTSVIESKIDNLLQNKLHTINPMIAAFITDDIKKKIKDFLMEELIASLPEITEKFIDAAEKNIDWKKMVFDKVEGFDIVKLEEIIMRIASKEFAYIEVLGGVLGFLIGMVQLAIIYFL